MLALVMFGAVLLLFSVLPAMAAQLEPPVAKSNLDSLQESTKVIEQIVIPEFERPQWYEDQLAAERVAATQPAPRATTNRQFTYTVSTKGIVKSSRESFAVQANKTLNDSRGWAQLGISFREVSNGGDFNLILSEASLLPSFSPGCSVDWSCRVGVSVIINDDRWQGATSAWNGAGGNLTDYRHYVVNHEVGHWLGHGHYNCGGTGQKAPVMLQQSINLQGCVPNPWPIGSELWTSR